MDDRRNELPFCRGGNKLRKRAHSTYPKFSGERGVEVTSNSAAWLPAAPTAHLDEGHPAGFTQPHLERTHLPWRLRSAL